MKLTDTNVDRPQRSVPERILVETNSETLAEWRRELDEYLMRIQKFPGYELDEIFTILSGYTARFSYIRSQIMRSTSRILQAFRTGEVDPFINECDRQFKFWSRVQSVNQMDWNAQRNIT